MDNKIQHTPGPWETSINSEEQWDVCGENAGEMIADLLGLDNQEANANLIAASPQMLAACKTALRLFAEIFPYEDRGEADHDKINEIREAIAKAEV